MKILKIILLLLFITKNAEGLPDLQKYLNQTVNGKQIMVAILDVDTNSVAAQSAQLDVQDSEVEALVYKFDHPSKDPIEINGTQYSISDSSHFRVIGYTETNGFKAARSLAYIVVAFNPDNIPSFTTLNVANSVATDLIKQGY